MVASIVRLARIARNPAAIPATFPVLSGPFMGLMVRPGILCRVTMEPPALSPHQPASAGLPGRARSAKFRGCHFWPSLLAFRRYTEEEPANTTGAFVSLVREKAQ